VEKLTGGFDNGLGAILIGVHSLASFLSKRLPEGISGLFQHYRSKPAPLFSARMSAFARCGHVGAYALGSNGPAPDIRPV
jgi:hypothetical protein